MSIFFVAGVLSAARAQGQTGTSPVPLEILKLKWEKQIQLPRNFDPSVIPTNGVFTDPARAANATSNPSTPPPSFESSPYVSFPSSPGRLTVVYTYSMRIRNIAAKAIEGVAWDYLFLDAASGREIGLRQFISTESIPPNKTGTFRAFIRTPPLRLIQVNDGEKTTRKLKDSASIQCVLYADRTVWRNPVARPGVCEFLAREQMLLRRNQRPHNRQ